MDEKELHVYSAEEVATHNTPESTFIILEGKVYDVTKFLSEHPGGEDVLLQVAGRDATSSFQDVGHSKDARALAEEYVVGRLSGADSTTANIAKAVAAECTATWKEIVLSPTWSNFLIPLAISLVVYGVYTGAKASVAYFL